MSETVVSGARKNRQAVNSRKPITMAKEVIRIVRRRAADPNTADQEIDIPV